MKQCKKCKHTLDKATNYCPYCGAMLSNKRVIARTVLIISIITLIISIVSSVIVVQFLVKRKEENKELRNAYIKGRYANEQNQPFENYFGTDVTPNELKNLLSIIRTNNLTKLKQEEYAVIGVCFISPNCNTDEEKGIYNFSIKDANEFIFDDINFTADVQSIVNSIKPNTSYTVYIPNKNEWSEYKEKRTGFEKDENPIGQTVKGSSGGYYSSRYIRLIYIVDNRGRQ